MKVKQIESIAKKEGAKVVLNSEEKIIVKDKAGRNHSIVPERHGGNITENQLIKLLGGNIPITARIKRITPKRVRVVKPGGEKFQDELEKIKGVGFSSAVIIALKHNKSSLKAALKADEDMGLSNGVMSALRKIYL